jgi:hypothetical protein
MILQRTATKHSPTAGEKRAVIAVHPLLQAIQARGFFRIGDDGDAVARHAAVNIYKEDGAATDRWRIQDR